MEGGSNEMEGVMRGRERVMRGEGNIERELLRGNNRGGSNERIVVGTSLAI
jgi:hypothetical protein